MAPSNIWSHALQYVTSRESYPEKERDEAGHALPLLASPVDPEAYAWLRDQSYAYATDPLVPGKVKRSMTVEHYEVQQGADSKLAKAIFRKQHEASSLELFFDLFFVGNLAIFTSVHAHIDAVSVANYIGFFSILWTTWFHICIYDVRFYTDCVIARVFKIACFLVMASFVGLAPIFKTINDGGSSRAFTGMALVMMSLRFILTIEYAIVFFFVKGFHRTFIPLILTMAVYLLSGFAFLATFLIDRRVQFTGMQGAVHMIRWYIILAVEIMAIVVINCFFRVLSFKHTHMVERAGLLTLIVIGEGIIGLTKASAYDLLGRNASIWTEAGLIVAGVILVYFIYVLYFNQIDNDHSEDRWGTIRQQIWVLTHYFLHIAILLTVEGQAAMLTWNSSRRGIMWFMSIYPSIQNPGAGFANNNELVAAVNTTLSKIQYRFHYYNLTDNYDPKTDLTTLQYANALIFNSSEWKANVSTTMDKIRWGSQYAIFYNFQAKGPSEIDYTPDYSQKVFLYNQAYRVTFEYFYIGAGALLLVIAAMSWFGKREKRLDEWGSIFVRVLAGLALPFMSLIGFLETPGDMGSWRYTGLQWFIPIVVFSYLAVLIADNLIKVFFSVRKRHGRRSIAPSLADVETGYRAEAEMAQNKAKTVKFQDDPGTQRTDSQESDVTLADGDSDGRAVNKGYTNISQHDNNDTREAIDGRDLEPDTLRHVGRDARNFSFEQQPLTEGRL